jgi:hypothetical protein
LHLNTSWQFAVVPACEKKSNGKSEQFASAEHSYIQRQNDLSRWGSGTRCPGMKVIVMGLSVERSHPMVDIAEAGSIISQLHEQVCGGRQRVHLTRADCDDTCVLVSRAELESLETALAMFANTQEFSGMCQMLSTILESAGEVHSPNVYADDIV